MKTKMKSAAGFAAAILIGCTAAKAQTASAPAAPKGWETTASGGLTITRGNSHSTQTTLGIDSKKAWDKDEALLGASAAYGKNRGSRDTGNAKGYGQYNHLIDERLYFGLRVDGENDDVADLSYRVKIAPLLGYYAIKNDKTTLAFEAGPSFIIERYNPPVTVQANPTTDSYVGVRFGERFEHKLSATTKIWQKAEYTPAVTDWTDKYLLSGEVGISTAITAKWDLRVVLQSKYDSNPPTNKRYTDTSLIVGTGYKF